MSLWACTPVSETDRILLVVTAPPDVSHSIESAVRQDIVNLNYDWVSASRTEHILAEEGGAQKRRRAVVTAQSRVRRAENLFRELEDERALQVLTEVIAELTTVHQEPEAVALLAQAHLLSGAIFMARGRIDAARSRLRRALDFNPALEPSRTRLSPQVLAELAALRASQSARPQGRLTVKTRPPVLQTKIYVDGQSIGEGPMRDRMIPMGRHLLRVSAPGYSSALTTFSLDVDRTLVIQLIPDREAERVGSLGAQMRAGEDIRPTLRLLSRRSGADRTLAVALTAAPDIALDGAPEIGARLVLEGCGETRVDALSDVSRAARQLASCESTSDTPRQFAAPPALVSNGLSTASEVPEKSAVYGRPWFWATAGVILLGVTTAIVAARSSGGPPDAIEVDVVPRP
ncbi:MAG: PEGA domain-containing protein [Myxococcota bacterium]